MVYIFGKLKARFVKTFPNFKPPAPKLPPAQESTSGSNDENFKPPASKLPPAQDSTSGSNDENFTA